jgi:hypothetical protein
VVAPLHVIGQSEEGLGAIDRLVDHLLVEAVIGNDGKAVAPEGGAELAAEADEIVRVAGHRNRFDAGQQSGG